MVAGAGAKHDCTRSRNKFLRTGLPTELATYPSAKAAGVASSDLAPRPK